MKLNKTSFLAIALVLSLTAAGATIAVAASGKDIPTADRYSVNNLPNGTSLMITGNCLAGPWQSETKVNKSLDITESMASVESGNYPASYFLDKLPQGTFITENGSCDKSFTSSNSDTSDDVDTAEYDKRVQNGDFNAVYSLDKLPQGTFITNNGSCTQNSAQSGFAASDNITDFDMAEAIKKVENVEYLTSYSLDNLPDGTMVITNEACSDTGN